MLMQNFGGQIRCIMGDEHVLELKDKATAIPHSRNYKGMGTSLWGNDFGIVWVDKP